VDLSLVWCLDLASYRALWSSGLFSPSIAEVLGAMSVSKVYIGNLAEDARDRDIEKLFKGYGRVRNIVVKHEGGYGFAEFDDREDAKDAVKDLDGSSFMGSRLRIEHARDSRDSRRDGGRWSPPRGRFSLVRLPTPTPTNPEWERALLSLGAGGTWSMLWTSWMVRSLTDEGSVWLKREAVAGGQGQGQGQDLGPGAGLGPGHVTGGAPPGTGLLPLQSLSPALGAVQGQGGGGPGAARKEELEKDIAISKWSLRRYCKDIAKHNFKTLATFNTRSDFVPCILQCLDVFVS